MKKLRTLRHLAMIPQFINCQFNHLIPSDILKNPEIKTVSKLLLILLLLEKNYDSINQLIEMFKKEGNSGIKKSLTELESYGFIEKVRVKYQKNKKITKTIIFYTSVAFKFDTPSRQRFLNHSHLDIIK